MQLPFRTTNIPMQASKWLTSSILIDSDEMAALFQELSPFFIFQASAISKIGEGLVSHEEFLATYSRYIAELKEGLLPDSSFYRQYFSTVFTTSIETLYAFQIENDQQLIRIDKPVVQLQPHSMNYSTADGKFRSMTFGSDSISWGIQFSYPQLYKDNVTQDVEQVGAQFVNTALFQKLQKWVRTNTVPTPFLVGDQKINIPMRLGKQCFSWINAHPQLAKKGLQVIVKM